jgi:Homeodomain-like domain
MRRSGKSKPVVWRWQARFMAEGVAGLTRDKTRKPGKKPLPASTVQRVFDPVLVPPPGETTHWTGRMLAKAAGVSLRSVQRILEAHQLSPGGHRVVQREAQAAGAKPMRGIKPRWDCLRINSCPLFLA